MNKKLKSKKANTNAGITLIALILTIIVLLILAVVAIQAVKGDGILAHARNAKAEYQNAQNNEVATLQNYTDYIAEQSGNNPTTGGEVYQKAKVNDIVKGEYNATMNGKAPSASNPIIPVGFAPINTETSSWGNGSGTPDENSVKNGLVITDSIDEGTKESNGNEFVWVPVKNINDMVMCQEHETTKLDETTLECSVCKEKTKLAGKLYAETTGVSIGTANLSYEENTDLREPDVVNDAEFDSNTDNLNKVLDNEHQSNQKVESFKDQLQKDFEKMAKSVAKYGGFYVGRYEMDRTGSSKKGKVAIACTTETYNWYGLYSKAKQYAQEDSNITSEMIWGCQFDAMMNWMKNDNQIEITEKNPTDTGRISVNEGKTLPNQHAEYRSGMEPNDRLNNIYDLLGNRSEWTQEACDTDLRIHRGGNTSNAQTVSYRDYDYPAEPDVGSLVGTRVSLYVNVSK